MSIDPTVAASPPIHEPADLEALLGDPRGDGPFGSEAIVAGDANRRANAELESLLDEWHATADAVPASLGGRWCSTEDLVRRWRPIFGRDPATGLGYAAMLAAATDVWIAGDEAQRAEVAARLRQGQRIAAPLGDGRDGGAIVEHCTAEAFDGEWVLHGELGLVVDADRSASLLIRARTDGGMGAGRRSLLLWSTDDATAPLVETRRIRTGGARGGELGTVAFRALRLPADRMIGEPGCADETARASAPVVRAVVPALAVAVADAALDLAIRYGDGRALYGGSVLDLPQSRALLAGAIADVRLAEALASVAVRALHVAPAASRILAAASASAVTRLLSSAMLDLSVLFGSTFYARVAPYDLFEKLLRDLAMLPLAYGGAAWPLLDVLDDLPGWTGRAAREPAAVDPALVRLGAPLDELDFELLASPAPGAADPIGDALRDPAVRARLAPGDAERDTLDRLADALDEVREGLAAVVPGSEAAADVSPEAVDLADRLALLLAAAAFAGTCAEGGAGATDATDATVREACLQRAEARLAGRTAPLEPHLADALVAALRERAARDIRSTGSAGPAADHAPVGTTGEGDA